MFYNSIIRDIEKNIKRICANELIHSRPLIYNDKVYMYMLWRTYLMRRNRLIMMVVILSALPAGQYYNN